MMKKLTLSLIIMTSLMLMMIGVQAMHFLGMNGSSLSVTSESESYPEETVLGDVVFDAQSGLVTIEGTISVLDLSSGGWPDTAYLEIGIRPEATKEETNAGVYMIVLGSSNSELLVFHMQDYGGHRPGGYGSESICVYVDAVKAEEGIDYRITLTGGTAYFEIWDADGIYYDGGLEPVEYGYSNASTLDGDFSEARLFYSLMADGGGVPNITYSATIGDITTNILLPHPEVWVDDDYYDEGDNDGHIWGINAFAKIQEGVDVVDEGGTVNVAAGTYTENIVIDKSLTVESVSGAEVTVIDALGAEAGVSVDGVATIVFKGFTVENFHKVGVVIKNTDSVQIDDNIITATDHSAAPNGIQIGVDWITPTTGTIKNNEISGCYWSEYGGEVYENAWTGSGILVIAPNSELTISSNEVQNSDVGLDIEAGLGTLITNNDVYDNSYGLVFWNADSTVSYNNIYSNALFGVYRTTDGSMEGTLDAESNWWGDGSGPSGVGHGTGDSVSTMVDYDPWDDDGILNGEDRCPITGADVLTKDLGTNRWMWDGSSWITKLPNGVGPQKSFTMEDTRGCNCNQILDKMGGKMTGHSKFGCSISVMEDFSAGLPRIFVETVKVYANDPKPTNSNILLKPGVQYELEAVGTADAGDTIDFDAKYSLTNRISGDTWTDTVSGYVSYGPDLLNLKVNDVFVDWGAYNPEHAYYWTLTGINAPVKLLIHDIYYLNNVGFITVNIYELQ